MNSYENGQVKGNDLKQLLEGAIDTNSLFYVLVTLSEIASEKAEHVLENWQDKALAGTWEKDARLLDKASNKVKN